MRRRDLLRLLAAAGAAFPASSGAQQRARPALVGIFTATDPSGRSLIPAETDAFHQAMHDLGYVEGWDASYIYHSNTGRSASAAELAILAPEFVRRKPDVIVTPGRITSPRLLMQAT